MNIKLIKLSVQGQYKTSKEVIFDEKNTLIQGSSDTGKSYILSAIYYCLNGTEIPRNVGYSSGYTTFILTFSLGDKKFTIIRDYAFNINKIYQGEFYETDPPQEFFISNQINNFIIKQLGLSDSKIVTKSGTLSNITLSNLKYFSFFNEDRTLSSDFFISAKENSKLLARKSLFSFLLTGQDDKKLELSTSEKQKNLIDGKLSAYKAELNFLNEWFEASNIDQSLSQDDIHEKIGFLEVQIEAKLDIKIVDQNLIKELNQDLNSIRVNINQNQNQIDKLNEDIVNFKILNEKYDSDRERLISILNTHLVFESFIDHNCPLCDSIMQKIDNEDSQDLLNAIEFEIKKIEFLKIELNKLIPDLKSELKYLTIENIQLNEKVKANLEKQLDIKNQIKLGDFLYLSNQRNLLEQSLSIFDRVEYINKLIDKDNQTKNIKIKVIRELAEPFSAISIRCKALLKEWGLTDIHNLYIPSDEMDLVINQRQRISFGKGKRAIFLTAFAISIMEYSISKKLSHLGFIIIDSPLVTHKDPKYGEEKLTEEKLTIEERTMEMESYMSGTVAQKFYKWLVQYNGHGQIIIIENDAPNEQFKNQINYIEFTGNSKVGRSGFF